MKFLFDLFSRTHILSACSTRASSIGELKHMVQSKTNRVLNWIEINQHHTNHFVEANNKKSIELSEPADGVWSCNNNTMLTIRTADCLPILIYHPAPIIAAIHAGRRGTDLNITYKLLKHLVQIVQSVKDFTIWLGPRICVKCYEIDPITHKRYDLVSNNLIQIRSVLGEHATIIDSKWCTSCQNELFFSYRKNERTTKRIYSCIGLDMIN